MARFASPSTLAGIAAPMAVWAVHFVVLYSLQGLACGEGWGQRGASWAMVGLTVPALAVIAWLGLRALRAARAAGAAGPAARRARFAAQAAALCAVLATVAVLFTVVPVLLLPACR